MYTSSSVLRRKIQNPYEFSRSKNLKQTFQATVGSTALKVLLLKLYIPRVEFNFMELGGEWESSFRQQLS